MSQSPPVITGISSKDRDRRVGITLKNFMRVTGVSRVPVAAAIGVTPAYVTRITNGEKPFLRDYREKVAAVLQIDPDALALPEELKERGTRSARSVQDAEAA